ncbi:putative bifunctional diguanylate cyclase/phosphodiesterase [Deinococcus oregonensis]|uniref:Bifunctional diguanylate cyclase/phosphodiesterase n=1 Tax=Deinococcus oregonensis TaxID=1805970 RepID=A0ABV6AZH7_9DEIO
MPDSSGQTQLEVIDTLTSARQGAATMILPIVCLVSISTIALTNDGLSHHIYNPQIYSVFILGFLVAWSGMRWDINSEWPYMVTVFACGFFLIAKFTVLILYATPRDFPVGLLEGMIWLYPVLVYALINSTLIFYWRFALGLMSILSSMSLFYGFSDLNALIYSPTFVSIIQFNAIGWFILYGSKGYMLRKELHTAHITRMTTLERVANTDILTNLRNRRYLERYLQDYLENPKSNLLSLMFIDIDSFKLVNDTLGHTKGDELLKQISILLLRLCGPTAVVTRLNGDEFVVVLPELGGEQAEQLSREILNHLQKDGLELGTEFKNFRLTLSIGISTYPENGLTTDELLRHADSAMFAVKRNGKQNVRRYNPADDADTEYRQELGRELAGALERGEISLVFQPLYDLQTGGLVKAEVLMRWHHPVFGWVSPAAFIPVAEQAGLINTLGLWALQQSCQYAQQWPEVVLCVNVSLLQLFQSNFAQQISEFLQEYDVPAGRLELELTETTLMQDNSNTIMGLITLRKTGLSLTIDDFGIGYSNLARLRTFPVEGLKMDQSFTRHLAGSELDQRYAKEMIYAVVQISDIAGLQVTAEGIETLEQLQAVRALGCHTGQGYFLARPCGPEQFVMLLNDAAPPTWATA